MDTLLNLKNLANELVKKYQSLFTGNEIELPLEFKQKVKKIDTSSISYQRYSAIVSTKGGQKGCLYIYFPNQWFYIASFFTKYYNELQKYKRIAIELFTTERLKALKEDSLTSAEKSKLNSKLSNNDSDLIEKFVTDYNWWGGGKTIDRGDYYVSPILNYASLVNVSQAYIADLCAFLAKNEELVALLQNRVNLETKKTNTISNNIIFSTNSFFPYLTALRTKPFMLLAGISGTGKSRIVRELAKACWKDGDEEYGKNNPRNFCMVQVKPNWHDSTELFGYVSRISGKPEFVAGDFLKFVVKAWEEPDVPYFLCLDEMNLAPVEQYFAEYLSVIESRKSVSGIITTDPLFKKPFEDRVYEKKIEYGEEIDWYQQLVIQLTSNEELQQQFYKEGITIPQNLFVVGTVNMDETTFSFSRKVLDRAMTIEMNEVNLYGGLDEEGSEIGYIGNCIIGTAAEGKDVYAENKELCDQVIAYLEKVNNVLDKTPFKIAYRTRNEFLLYAVNRQLLDKDSQLWQTLDEMTSMKILSRIEGDSERTKEPLNALKALVEENILNHISEPEEGKEKAKSITAPKIKEMLEKLEKQGYTSYWT